MLYDPGVNSPLASAMRIGGQPIAFAAPDDFSVTMTLPAPFAPGSPAALPAVLPAPFASAIQSIASRLAARPVATRPAAGGGSGTGFLVDSDGTIVTNAHVVGDNSQVKDRSTDEGDLADPRGPGGAHTPEVSAPLVPVPQLLGPRAQVERDRQQQRVANALGDAACPAGLAFIPGDTHPLFPRRK